MDVNEVYGIRLVFLDYSAMCRGEELLLTVEQFAGLANLCFGWHPGLLLPVFTVCLGDGE